MRRLLFLFPYKISSEEGSRDATPSRNAVFLPPKEAYHTGNKPLYFFFAAFALRLCAFA